MMSGELFFFLAYGTALAVLVGAAGLKIRDLRARPDHQALRALVGLLIGLSGALALIVVGHFLEADSAGSGLVSTTWHVLTLWAATAFQAFLLYSALEPALAQRRVLLRLATCAAASVAMIVALSGAGGSDEHGFRVFDLNWQSALWQLAFLLTLGWAMTDGCRTALQHSRVAHPHALRVGLRLMAAGAAAGVMFCAAKIATGAIQTIGVGAIVPGTVLVLLVVLTAIGIAGGLVYPVLDTRVRSIPRWLARRRRHRALWPLWHDVHKVVPTMLIDRTPSSRTTDLLRLRHLHWRHYRRVVEIYDGLLHLRPWFQRPDTDTGADAAAPEDEQEAVSEAAALEHALRTYADLRHQLQRQAEQDGLHGEDRDQAVVNGLIRAARTSPPTPTQHVFGATGTLDEAAEWLVRVQHARQYARPARLARQA